MKSTKKQQRLRRKMHIRKTVRGTSTKPRIYVFKSNRYFSAGLADDVAHKTIKSLRCAKNGEDIKKMAAEFAKEASKYDSCVFDRSGYMYHGLVEEFANELRNNKVNI